LPTGLKKWNLFCHGVNIKNDTPKVSFLLISNNRNSIHYKLNDNLYLITTSDIYMINQPKQGLPPRHVQGLSQEIAPTHHEKIAGH